MMIRYLSGIMTAIFIGLIPASTTRAEEKPHSPVKAMMLSAVVPGGGQWYNQKKPKSLIIGTFEITMFVSSGYSYYRYRDTHNQDHLNTSNLFLFGGIMSVCYSISDAYIDAHFYNFDRWKIESSRTDQALYLKVAYSF